MGGGVDILGANVIHFCAVSTRRSLARNVLGLQKLEKVFNFLNLIHCFFRKSIPFIFSKVYLKNKQSTKANENQSRYK